MIDAVLTPHPNEWTCGTGKWSVRLAEHLGVPCLPLDGETNVRHALISTRLTELPAAFMCPAVYDLIIHDWTKMDRGPTWRAGIIVQRARRVYAANPVLAEQVRPIRADVQTIWCPSSLRGNPDRGAYRVLTYGMAHKITAPYYQRLKMLLDGAGLDYTVSVSTAVHEGSPWQDSIEQAADCLRAIFGDRLRVLGYLADDALARELQECDCVALFYDPALRSNNTTAWAALEAGRLVVTNLDAQSPAELFGPVVNIATTEAWPFRRGHVGPGRVVAAGFSWSRLTEMLLRA